MAIERPALLWALLGSNPDLAGTIRVEIGGVGYTVNMPALDPDEFYYLIGDGSSVDLIKKYEDAFNDQLSGQSFALTQNGNGQLHINCDDEFRILGGHVNTTVDLTPLGLDNVANHPAVSGSQDYDAPDKMMGNWCPIDQNQAEDDLDQLPIVAAGATTWSGKSRILKLNRIAGRERDFEWMALDGALVRDEQAAANGPYSTFEYGWNASISEGYPFRYYNDTSVRSSVSFKTYRLRLDNGPPPFPWKQTPNEVIYWDVTLKAIRTDD